MIHRMLTSNQKEPFDHLKYPMHENKKYNKFWATEPYILFTDK